MNYKIYKVLTIQIVFFLSLSLGLTENIYSQTINKIFEVPGGGSGSTNTSVEKDKDYTVYIVGGLLVTSVIIYALLRDKKEKPTQDTTAVILDEDFLKKNLSLNEKVSIMQSQIPINISFGMQHDKSLKDERRYFIGLNYNF